MFTMAPPTPGASHKPRKKRKGDEIVGYGGDYGVLSVDGNGKQRPAFPLVGFIWPAKSVPSQWTILPLILMAVGLFRWSTAFWDYSGMFPLDGG